MPGSLRSASIGSGLFRIYIWKSDDGAWHYDGPASSGPEEVRRSGRGPSWMGKVEESFVKDLLRRAEEMKLPIDREER